MHSHEGQVVAGKYRIGALIGAGGMGRVYQAHHLLLEGEVALKFLNRAASDSEVVRERFRREAQVLARLRHPGVVSVLDFGEHAGELYMAMEWVKGVSLAAEIEDPQKPLSLERIGALFDQLLDVLEVVHAAGVVHRDLKPENVMLMGERLKVLDFGLALTEDAAGKTTRLTQTGSVQGTPHYMSPEQCRGAEVGPATDVYAVGCMLFEALAGVPPFDAMDTAGLMTQQMFVEAPLIASVGIKREIPMGLERVVQHAMTKSEAARPTALQFREALRLALAGKDADSQLARATQERLDAAMLNREARALGSVVERRGVTSQQPDGFPRVAVWTDDEPTARALRDLLSVNGIRVTLRQGPDVPPTDVEGDPIRALVLTSADGQRADILRACNDSRPFMVVGVTDVQEVTHWIAKGAADVVLVQTAQDELAKKVKRMLKRKR